MADIGEDCGTRVLGSVWHMIGELEVAGLVADHADLRRLCDRLELIADMLPERPCAAEAETCRRALEDFFPRHCDREERLFDRLFAVPGGSDVAAMLLSQIRAAHLLDKVHAQDLSIALSSEPARPVARDTLAYMLRCFFDGCRRAMAFEELALLFLGRGRLTGNARAMIEASFEGPSSAA